MLCRLRLVKIQKPQEINITCPKQVCDHIPMEGHQVRNRAARSAEAEQVQLAIDLLSLGEVLCHAL